MPLDSSVLVLAMDDRIWVDSESLIAYLREVEDQAQRFQDSAQEHGDIERAAAAYSSKEMVRQIADGLVLTTMVAGDQVRSRRAARR